MGIVSQFVRAWIGLNVSEAELLIKSPSVGRWDWVVVVRGASGIVLKSCPADGAAIGSAFANPVSRHTCMIVFIEPHPAVQRVENQTEIEPGRREDSGVGP